MNVGSTAPGHLGIAVVGVLPSEDTGLFPPALDSHRYPSCPSAAVSHLGESQEAAFCFVPRNLQPRPAALCPLPSGPTHGPPWLQAQLQFQDWYPGCFSPLLQTEVPFLLVPSFALAFCRITSVEKFDTSRLTSVFPSPTAWLAELSNFNNRP